MSCGDCCGHAAPPSVSGGLPPGGALPAGDDVGNLLQWNGTLWVPVVTPTAEGQIIAWDADTGEWVAQGAPSANGDVLVWNAATESWVATQLVNRTVLVYNALALTTGTTTLFPSGDTGTNSTAVGTWAIPCPWDGRLQRMRVLHNAPTGTTNIVYTFEVNEVATALTVSINSGTQAGSDLTNIVNVTAGQRIRLRAVHALGATLSIRPVVIAELWIP